jgi:hypothetical protein
MLNYLEEKYHVPRSGEVAQTMYTHVSKCKNDKIKKNFKVTCQLLSLKWCDKK